MLSQLLDITVITGILASMIRLATPYIYAAIGETFGQKSGVLNLGVDGVMLISAFTSYYIVLQTGNLFLAMLVTIIIGAIMGLLMALISVTLHAEQGISGIGIFLFGLGLSDLLFQKLVGTAKPITGFQDIAIPVLSKIPILGEVLFKHSLLVYGAYILIPIAWFVLNKTTFGLNIRAVGENPAAADSLGVNVALVRYKTLIIGGILSAIAGASLSIALLNVFQQNLTNGLGFIAVALVYFGAWRPFYVLLGSLIFSFVNALQVWIQVLGIPIPSDIAVMMPYVLTLLVLVISAGKTRAPTALTKPYERNE